MPILRIFDEAKAREFYVDSSDECLIHLSEHYGDSTPGAAVRKETSDIDAFHRELIDKRYKYARPGIQDQPWGVLPHIP